MSLDSAPLDKVQFNTAKVDIYTSNHKKTFTLTIEREKLEKKRGRREPTTFEAAYQVVTGMWRSKSWVWKYSDDDPALRDTKRWRHRYLPTTRLYLSPTGNTPQAFRYESDPD